MLRLVVNDWRGPAMYERFFDLDDLPFRLTPDPKYLYLSEKHREAYAHLLYGLTEGSGFVAVTGEIGTGKTTLVRALLRESPDDVAVAYVFNPVLTGTELLQTINAEFGLPSRSSNKKELVAALNEFLLARKSDGGRAVVIVDEAQNLDPVVLEELRLLSNLETETEKLLRIILLGQPELRGILERPELRQLAQRIDLRWHLDPLDRDETHAYVRHRLTVAGGDPNLFEPRALDVIHDHAGGVPRLINVLGHRSLLVAYTRGIRRITPAEVSLAAVELELGRVPLYARSTTWLVRLAASAAVAIAAGVVALMLVAPLADHQGDAAKDAVRPPSVGEGSAGKARSKPSRRANAGGGKQLAARTAARRRERGERARNSGRGSERPSAAVSSVPRSGRIAAGAGAVSGSGEPSHTRTAAKPPTRAGGMQVGTLPARDRSAETAAAPAPAGSSPAAAARPGSAAAGNAAPALVRLDDLLPRAPEFESAAGAISRLLELWSGRPLTPAERAVDTLDMQVIGARRSLRYTPLAMPLTLLERLDLPAVVELKGKEGLRRFVLLEKVGPTRARLVLDRPVVVGREDLIRHWGGRVHILWRDAMRISVPLSPGNRGPAVLALQRLLQEAGLLAEQPTGVYDHTTRDAVRALQEASGISPSGAANALTQIALYSRLKRFVRPSLVESNAG